MRTILGLFALLFCGYILAWLTTPPLRPIYAGSCTEVPSVDVLVGGVALSVPSMMHPDLAEMPGQEKVRRDRDLRYYCKEQATSPLLVSYIFLKYYPDGKPFGPEMAAIYIGDNPYRAQGEKAILDQGATIGPDFFGAPTIVVRAGALKTVDGPTKLYRVVGRFHNAQVTLNLDTMNHPDPTPILRTAEVILNKIRSQP